MRNEQMKAITELRNQVPEAFGKPATDDEIIQAEETLGVKLPDAYKDFLKKFGSGGVGKAIILGLSEAEFVATPSFVDTTLEFREEFFNDLPEYHNIIVIGVDGSGNPIGYLPDSSVIFVYDHDFGGRYDLANDFCDYVDKSLDRTLKASF